ncbi:peptidylprolyl isomerase [Lysinibacillus sp. 2017]|uniref:peptidylprolyl isomerase n=1 Tax=unclassified Lysinibacillus TaxID=2636778 RepID=UPI000D529827|nr:MULTISPECIES: peptidylprolyl isomerase [unclassified Lysinibacillus]AWE07724.1 peptidylprolyl isomerase [Lysinibacillus sp. 2017]TGN32294.1 peptidylprolyl isomerase [Lysinibacillus sp. S2017]
MKKLFCLILFFTLILAACNSSKLSISEIQSVPNKVQDAINSDYTLQRISDGKKNTYIIFQSTGTVTADLEVIENILNIKLDSENQENNELKQHVYKLTSGDAEYDTINVLVNGKATPFDNSTGF